MGHIKDNFHHIKKVLFNTHFSFIYIVYIILYILILKDNHLFYVLLILFDNLKVMF